MILFQVIFCLPLLAMGQEYPADWCHKPIFKEAYYDGPVERVMPGHKLMLRCKTAYKEGRPLVTCQEGNKWSEPQPKCELIVCPDVERPKNGFRNMTNLFYNATIHFGCHAGFVYIGSQTRLCQRNGQWSGMDGICTEIECPTLPDPVNGRINSESTKFRSKATPECDEGYVYSGSDSAVRYCLANRTWTGRAGICQDVLCPELHDPEHGEMIGSSRSYLANVSVECHHGYTYSLPDSLPRTCLGNNSWSGVGGKCEAVPCPDIQLVEHGLISAPGGQYQDKILLQCHSGHTLDGPSTVTCQADGTWSAGLGTCLRSSNYWPWVTAIILIALIVITAAGIGCWMRWKGKCRSSKRQQEDTELADESPGPVDEQTTTVTTPFLSPPEDGCMTSMPDLSQEDIGPSCNVIQQDESPQQLISPPSVLPAPTGLPSPPPPPLRPPPTTGPPQLSTISSATGPTELYGSFTLNKDFEDEYKSGTLDGFTADIKSSIENMVEQDICIQVVGTIFFLCQASRTIFFKLTSSKSLDETEVSSSMKKIRLSTRKTNEDVQYEVSGSIAFEDKVKITLAAFILKKKHKLYEGQYQRIDIDTQYVGLKLSQNEIGMMQRDALETPHHYQSKLEKHGGKDIKDEELVKPGDYGKYILVCGGAGIGKTTLVQRCMWKWSNGVWATQFKALFLLNLRHIMMLKIEVDLPHLLSIYPVYNTYSCGVTLSKEWLKENEDTIGFIFDGIDEIENFKEHWQSADKLTSPIKELLPLTWCFALMKRIWLKKSTLLITSRPFKDLALIEGVMKDPGHSQDSMFVEVMGLTRERVMEFVKINAPKGKGDLVQRTLVANPILMSVSSIPFYCAALCQVLGAVIQVAVQPKTYTQIMAYIMQMFMEQSRQRKLSPDRYLNLLSELAFNGLINDGSNGLPRLVFDESDFSKLKEIMPVSELTGAGLLMQTEVSSSGIAGKEPQFLSQFIHLSIQEFLAMAGLLRECPDKVKHTLTQLTGSGQFNMTLLFLYGLAFDSGNGTISKISNAIGGQLEQRKVLQDLLIERVTDVSSDLQALQLAHESQSPQVAHQVGEVKFPEEIRLSFTKLTVVDVMAMTFVLRNHSSTEAITLKLCDLDLISIKELASFLEGNDTVKTLTLQSNGITDRGAESVAQALTTNTTLQKLELESDGITDRGAESVAQALTTNTTLQKLELQSDGITDRGAESVAQVLTTNTTLQELRLSSDGITDRGAESVAHHALTTNQTLQKLELWSQGITDRGAESVAQALTTNKTLQKLMLLSNSITDRGVKSVAQALTTLQQLTLYDIEIGDQGADALLEALKMNTTLKVRLGESLLDSEQVLDKLKHSRIDIMTPHIKGKTPSSESTDQQ